MTTSNNCLHEDDMQTDEGSESSSEESVCQLEVENQSPINFNNPPCPVSCHESVSLQSVDYCDLPAIVAEHAEQPVTVAYVTFDLSILRKKLVTMFVLHEYPLSMFDHLGFKDFLHNLNPLYARVSNNTLEKDIMRVFEIEKQMAHAELSSEDMPSGRVAITTKMWTSSDCNRKFLAITGHVIDHKWKKQAFIMRFANVPLPCTNESISKIILDCFSYFDVEKKLSTITVDNYTSDDELVDILVDKLSANKPLFKGKLFRLPCFAHTTSLMVQEGFEVVRHVIEKIRDSIVFWTSSLEREMTFKKAVFELGVKARTNLVLDDGLSWSSTYLMLQESLIFKDVFSYLGEYESQYNSLPSKEEWDLAQEVCNRLQLLYDHTTLLAEGLAACLYVLVLSDIKVNILEWLNCEVPGIKEMASKMEEKFDRYWFEARDFLGIAAVLDPRYKFNSLKPIFSKIYGNKAEIEVERIHKIFYDLFNVYKCSIHLDKTNDEENLHSPQPRRGRGLRHLWLKMMEEEEQKQCEVDLYSKHSKPNLEDSEILSWWLTMTKFPVLHKMAKDILAIPIFSVDTANAFDVGDRILGANRSRHHPTMVEALKCTQQWVRRREYLNSEASSSACKSLSLGTIYDDAYVEQGIIFKANSA